VDNGSDAAPPPGGHLRGDWFAQPEAGKFLRGLWATGESKENEDVVRTIGHEPFDTTYLVEQFLGLR
jgi:hypothetical protein